ncbi:MAG: hypothetical protein K1X66_01055 [Verrucomicrobiae bacterium]|nr:hypothetical protein [Verrucomicrobiae bacterium]
MSYLLLLTFLGVTFSSFVPTVFQTCGKCCENQAQSEHQCCHNAEKSKTCSNSTSCQGLLLALSETWLEYFFTTQFHNFETGDAFFESRREPPLLRPPIV